MKIKLKVGYFNTDFDSNIFKINNETTLNRNPFSKMIKKFAFIKKKKKKK